MAEQKRAPTFQSILLSLFIFVLLWAKLTDAWGYSSHLTVSSGKFIYACFSRLIWVAPAIWLILRHRASLCYGKGVLFSRPVWNRSLVSVLIGSLIFTFAAMLVTHRGFWLNPSVNYPSEIIKIILVGFVEEIVFRGWGYNALAKVSTDRKAVVYSTVFFVLLHLPAYFVRLYRFDTMDYAAWLGQSLAAAVWGVLCCILLKRGRTLWNPIIAHTVYDVLCVLLVG